MPSGYAALTDLVRAAGYDSILHAVALNVVFLHPDTVAQTGMKPVFPVVRSNPKRGTTEVLESGEEVLYDDNYSPTVAFTWAAGWTGRPKDLQFNHVATESSDVRCYTALWNLCVTPTFLAKPTDGHADVRAALAYRSHELYGSPAFREAPAKPDGYDDFKWGPVTEPIPNLGDVMRQRMAKTKEKRMLQIRRIGWLFGEAEPSCPPEQLRAEA
jgi:hypothetical protein